MSAKGGKNYKSLAYVHLGYVYIIYFYINYTRYS